MRPTIRSGVDAPHALSRNESRVEEHPRLRRCDAVESSKSKVEFASGGLNREAEFNFRLSAFDLAGLPLPPLDATRAGWFRRHPDRHGTGSLRSVDRRHRRPVVALVVDDEEDELVFGLRLERELVSQRR